MSTDHLGRQWPRRVRVEQVGFAAPRAADHDKGDLMGGAEHQPPETKQVVGALFTGAVRPQTINPREMSLRATQTHLTRGSLLKHLEAPQYGRGGGGVRDTPVLLKHPDGHHYVLDGHHRLAGALQRGESIQARVLDVSNPEHHALAQQFSHAGAEVAAAYRQHLEAGQRLAGSRGKGLFGPNGDTEARSQVSEAFTRMHPEYAKNAKRKELGLPPRRRR